MGYLAQGGTKFAGYELRSLHPAWHDLHALAPDRMAHATAVDEPRHRLGPPRARSQARRAVQRVHRALWEPSAALDAEH